MTERTDYEVVVVGGGPAGLTAALYTTRLGHETVLVDRGGGRAAMMLDTHNVIGVTEEVSGNEFLQTATEQVESYGADVERDLITTGEPTEVGFRLAGSQLDVTAERVVLATGFTDVRPDPPLPRTGQGLQYCLHCDAYMFVDEPVYVMGHGESAATVAMIMLNFTDEVDLLTRGNEPAWSAETDRQLRAHPVDIVHEEITGMETDDDGWLVGFAFADGSERPYRGGFPMYGAEYNTDLAEDLGCTLTDGGQIAVDDHYRTSVDGVYAVGDVVPGHSQIPVAMGQGATAGIDIHYDLRRFPMSIDELEAHGEVESAEVPAMAASLRERARSHDGHAGGPTARADD